MHTAYSQISGRLVCRYGGIEKGVLWLVLYENLIEMQNFQFAISSWAFSKSIPNPDSQNSGQNYGSKKNSSINFPFIAINDS